MKVKVTDIVYDTDGIVSTEMNLPSEMILIVDSNLDVESEIANAISDKTGWCVEGYNYEIL
jgi:hypothetical protein